MIDYMISYFVRVAPLLWPHAVLIIVAAWLGARSCTAVMSTAAALAVAAVATLLYSALQNGVAPEWRPVFPALLLRTSFARSLTTRRS